jgi:hypothetical protein
VTVVSKLSSSGALYCAASRSIVPSSIQLVVAENNVGWTSEGHHVNVTLWALIPSTAYNVYCVTQSEGVYANLSQTLENKLSVVTKCCRLVTLSLSVNSAYGSASMPSVGTLSVPSVQSGTLIVTISAALNSSSSEQFVFFPFNSTFTSYSTGSISVAFVGGVVSAGYYNISVKLTGSAASNYAVFFSNENIFRVLSDDESPMVPTLESARFANDGSFVSIVFNSATNKGGIRSAGRFVCSQIFECEGCDIANCQWSSDNTTIIMYPGPSSSLVIGGFISLMANKIQAGCPSSVATATCKSWSYLNATTAVILAPTSQITPAVVMSLPTNIGSCDDLILSFGASSGSGGRSWSSINVTFSTKATNTTCLSAYVKTITRSRTAIPHNCLQKGQAYTFYVSLCNFLGSCGQSSASVTVQNAVIPYVSIAGGPIVSVFVNRSLQLSSVAYVSDCAGSKSTQNLQYTWTLATANGTTLGSIVSKSKDPSKFILTAHQLAAFNAYTISLTVRSTATSVSSVAAVSVVVPAASLIPIIAGGVEQTVRLLSSFTVDSSASYDSGQGSSGRVGISIIWQCHSISPTYADACPFNNITGGNDFSLYLFATRASANTSSEFTMTIFDSTRSATNQAIVRVLNLGSPIVSITTTQGTKIEVDAVYLLQGLITVDIPCDCAWTVDDFSIDLDSVSSVPPNKRWTPSSLTTFSSFLSISANALPAGSTLTFSLSCIAASSPSTAFASISVTTNSPPSPGIYEVEPLHGYALVTIFAMSASSWIDSDVPISYEFGFISPSNSSFVVQTKSQLAYATSVVPAGSSAKNSSLLISFQIFDNLGSSVKEYLTVRVVPVILNETTVNALTTTLLDQAVGSVDNLKQVISVISSTMTAVNCSASPNCTALNRLDCAATENTCGPCISAQYVGTASDSNTTCVDAAAFGSELLSVGSVCSSVFDCGSWSFCNYEVNSCAYVSKACQSNCSGAGICEFIESATQESVTACTVLDSSCEAKCVCHSGRYGPDCSLTESQMVAVQDTTNQLLAGLQQVNSLEELDEQSVVFRASALQSITSRTSTLSSSGASLAANVSYSILSACVLGSVALSSTVLIELSSVVNSVISASASGTGRRLDTAVSDISISEQYAVLDKLSEAVMTQMVSGQDNQNYVLPSYRLVASALDPVFASNITVPLPQTQLEARTNAGNSKFGVVSPSGIATIGAIDLPKYVVAASLDSDSLAGNISANALRINLQFNTSISCDDSTNAGYMEFSFAHNDDETWGIANTSMVSVTTQCYAGIPRSYEVSCPYNQTVALYCNGSTTTQVVVQCPKLERIPVCSVFVGKASVGDSDICVVVNYTAAQTVCRCQTCKLEAATRRKLSSVSRDFTAQGNSIVALSAYSFVEYASIMESVGDLSSLSLIKSTILIIVAFAVLWIAMGLLIIGQEMVRQRSKSRNKAKLDLAVSPNSSSVGSSDEAATLEECIRHYITELFSPAFSDDSDTIRLARELWNQHQYMSVLAMRFGYQQWIGAFYLLTNLNSSFFLLALFYDIQFANDDGTCKLLTTESSCMKKKSLFDASESKCLWDSVESACAWQSPHFDFFTSAAVSVIVLLVSVPVSFCIYYVFEFILLAPSVMEVREERSKKSLGRRQAATVMLDSQSHGMGTLNSHNNGSVINTEAIMAYNRDKQKSSVSLFAEVHEMQDTIKRASKRARQLTSIKFSTRKTGVTEQDAEHKTRNYKSFPSFMDDLRQFTQHHNEAVRDCALLNKEVKDEFLAVWGPLIHDEGVASISMHATAAQELAAVVTEAEELLAKMVLMPPEQVGVQLLELFVRDYVGQRTREAKIFSQKMNPLKPKYVVTWGIKCTTFACIILLNLYFVFACVLYGHDKGQRWQGGWLFTCVVNLGVDVFINAVLVAIIMHYFVPNLVVDKARRVKATLNRIVHGLCSNVNLNLSARQQVSATSYYFVSAHVARAFPDLLESRIVLAGSSCFLSKPQLANINTDYASRQERGKRSMQTQHGIGSVRNLIGAKLRKALLWFGSQSLLIQETVINMFTPGIVAAIAFAGFAIMKHSLVGIAAGFASGVACGVIIYYVGKFVLGQSASASLLDMDWIEVGMNVYRTGKSQEAAATTLQVPTANGRQQQLEPDNLDKTTSGCFIESADAMKSVPARPDASNNRSQDSVDADRWSRSSDSECRDASDDEQHGLRDLNRQSKTHPEDKQHDEADEEQDGWSEYSFSDSEMLEIEASSNRRQTIGYYQNNEDSSSDCQDSIDIEMDGTQKEAINDDEV